MKTDLIKNIIKENNGIITAREIKSHNIDSWYLTDMIRKGELERVSRGIYFDPTFNNFDELFFLQQQYGKCIYSYQTALLLHGLTDRNPFINEVTVYQGYNAWRFKNKVNVHQIKKDWYQIGIMYVDTIMGNTVTVYDMERTICDIVRDRKKQDPEIFSKAWNLYLKKQNKNIWRLRDYAEIFGISNQIEDILEIIYNE